MKRVFVFLFILVVHIAFSQREKILNRPKFDGPRFRYGFYLGLNKNSFKIAYKPSEVSKPNVKIDEKIGFNVGLIADFKLNDNLNLRFEPGLVSNNKDLYFTHIQTKTDSVREAGSTFLHLPFLLKASTNRLNNIRPYVIGGVSFDYNFASNEKNGNDNASGEFRMKSVVFMYEVGIGIDLYLRFFKLSPSIRGLFALNNEIKYDNNSPSAWTDPIHYMGTRGVFLHVAFE